MSTLPAGLVLRKMTLDDLPQVYHIELKSFSLPWPFKSYVYEVTESQVSRCYVAATVDDNMHKKILGMVVLYVIEDEAHVATFAIHNEYRRAGIGWRLLHHALYQAVGEGITHAFLEVRVSNFAAIKMYEMFGFKTVNTRKNYYIDTNEDALLMNLDELSYEVLDRIETQFKLKQGKIPARGNHDG